VDEQRYERWRTEEWGGEKDTTIREKPIKKIKES
jgi:hypothetical protein